MDGTVSIGLQSGFVMAAVLLVVFLADRLGGQMLLARRVFQVALGLAIAFVVIAGTTAFHPPPDVPEDLGPDVFGGSSEDEDQSFQEFRELSQDSANNGSENQTIHLGVGLLLIIGAMALMKTLRVLPLAMALGGLLLLLFGTPQGGAAPGTVSDTLSLIYSTFLPSIGGEAGQSQDIAQFAVLLAGMAALAWLGYVLWERPEPIEEQPVMP